MNKSSIYCRSSSAQHDNCSGYSLAIDIGASNPLGTIKIVAKSATNEEIYSKRGYLSDKRFESEDEFIDKVVEHIVTSIEKINIKIDANENIPLPEKPDKKIFNSLILLLPGPIVDFHARIIANIKKSDGSSLYNVNLMAIKEKTLDVAAKNGFSLSERFHFVTVKDLTGTGVALARLLIRNTNYIAKITTGNFFAVGIMTGGGFGSIDIKAKTPECIEIEASESSHNLAVRIPQRDIFPDNEIIRLGKVGATTKGIIENYIRYIGVSDQNEINILVNTGNAKIATLDVLGESGSEEASSYNTFMLEKKLHSQAIKIINEIGLFNIINENDNKIIFSVRNEIYVVKRHKEARINTIDDYADAVAWHAITRINEGANLVILTGPLALGINQTIMRNSQEFKRCLGNEDIYKTPEIGLADIVLHKIDSLIGQDNTSNVLRQAFNFTILCNDEFKIEDNTEGAAILLDESTYIVGNGKRADWVNLSTKTLLEYDK